MRIGFMRGVGVLLSVAMFASSAPEAFAAFEEVGAGARAPAMGNAVTAIADDVYAAHYNPAGLSNLERLQVGAAHSRLHLSLDDGSSLGQSQIFVAQPLQDGENGTLAASWHNFSLDGAYSENIIGLAYGRRVWEREEKGSLDAGLGLRRLSWSFTPGSEASNAMGGTAIHPIALGQLDPVLSGDDGTSALGVDLGLLYLAPRRFSVGLSFQNLNQPSIGVADSGVTQPMLIRGGVAWKALWMNLAAEVQTSQHEGMERDTKSTLAVERVFPSIDFGHFGVRGAISLGSRDFRQASAGISYKINRFQLDYAFVMPLGDIESGAGSHRIALGLRFGAPTPEEEYTQRLVSQLQRVETRAEAGLGYEADDVRKPASLERSELLEVRQYVDAGRFGDAHQRLLQIVVKNPNDESLMGLARRLDAVAAEFGVLESKPKWKDVLRRGAREFMDGRDHRAVLLTGYARSLEKLDPALRRLAARVESMTGRSAPKIRGKGNLFDELVSLSDRQFRRKKYREAVRYVRDALVLEPKNKEALKRLGSNLYLSGRYNSAVRAWTRALAVEPSARERRLLQGYIKRARQAQKTGVPLALIGGKKPSKREKLKRSPRRRRSGRRSLRAIERIYQKGTEHYLRGEYDMAEAAFKKVLRFDPENVEAKKALQRVRRRRN